MQRFEQKPNLDQRFPPEQSGNNTIRLVAQLKNAIFYSIVRMGRPAIPDEEPRRRKEPELPNPMPEKRAVPESKPDPIPAPSPRTPRIPVPA